MNVIIERTSTLEQLVSPHLAPFLHLSSSHLPTVLCSLCALSLLCLVSTTSYTKPKGQIPDVSPFKLACVVTLVSNWSRTNSSQSYTDSHPVDHLCRSLLFLSLLLCSVLYVLTTLVFINALWFTNSTNLLSSFLLLNVQLKNFVYVFTRLYYNNSNTL